MIDSAQLVSALRQRPKQYVKKIAWDGRKYLLFPFWVIGQAMVWMGARIAWSGQWMVILCEEVERLPDMPDDYRIRNGAEL